MYMYICMYIYICIYIYMHTYLLYTPNHQGFLSKMLLAFPVSGIFWGMLVPYLFGGLLRSVSGCYIYKYISIVPQNPCRESQSSLM